MDGKIHVMYSEEQIDARIRELGAAVSADLNGEPVHLVCVLKGASFFACELAKRMTVPVYMDFMCVSSYGNDTQSSGEVRIVKDLDDSVEGQHVLIAEDIIDSGNTLRFFAGRVSETRGGGCEDLCAFKQTRPKGDRGAGRLYRLCHTGCVRGGLWSGLRADVPQPSVYRSFGYINIPEGGPEIEEEF